ncbi:MAG: hypothetical protein HC819_13620 [Cyclobacteriaceae bacterium]|nr:hypothetical protein [Cyclobacteriaceae bacterium]
MNNLENYLYIIFAVIYIISRIVKARAKQRETKLPEQEPQSYTKTIDRKAPPKKAFSFEDIIKEFERNLSGDDYADEKPEPIPERKLEALRPKPAPRPMPTPANRPSEYETYEGMTYESQMAGQKEEEYESLLGRNERFTIKQDVANEYAKMLQDPEGIKNAIVINEIINRKYF